MIDGIPVNGFYSMWDEMLFGTTDDSYLINEINPDECCKIFEFNFIDYPNLPDDVVNSCSSGGTYPNIVIGANSIATVNAGYDAPSSNNLLFLNALSHLDAQCDNVPYIIHFEFGNGEHRRNITAEELTILCELGYEVSSTAISCNSCIVEAVDDFFVVNNSIIAYLSAGLLTFNDTRLGDWITNNSVEIDLECGDASLLHIEETNPGQNWSITNFQVGQIYQLCYTVTACDGICDQGVIYLSIDTPLPPCPPIEDACSGENLFCYGTIQDFSPVLPISGYHSELSLNQFCDPFGIGASENSPGIGEDADGNKYVVVVGRGLPNEYYEGMMIPLTKPIQAGCNFKISFDARVNPTISPNVLGELEIYGSSEQACEVVDIVDCPGDNDLLNSFYCMIPSLEVNSTEWESFDLFPQNLSNEAINFLMIANRESSQFIQFTNIDNIEVTNLGCDYDIEVSSDVLSNCNDNVIVELEICISGEGEAATDVTIEALVPELPYIENTGGDFVDNVLVIEDVEPGDGCVTKLLNIEIDDAYPAGLIFEIPLQVTAPNSCISSTSSLLIETEDCTIVEFTCPCTGINPINIEAGTGTLWHEIEELQEIAHPSIFSPNTIDLSTYCVAINGKLLVDADPANPDDIDLLFVGGALRMQPESEIVVTNGADLGFLEVDDADDQGTGIHGCDYMWQGITVESGGTVRLVGSQIEDAIHAVSARDQSLLWIRDNVFDNNHIGIYAPAPVGQAVQTINTAPSGLAGNTFNSSSGLLGSLDGTVVPGNPGRAGIELEKVAYFSVGSSTTTNVNHFENLAYGIHVTSSYVGVFNAEFDQIINAGIRARRSGYVTAFDNDFTVMNHGIHSDGFGITALRNTMTDLRVGVAYESSLFGTLKLLNNDITADQFCVSVTAARLTSLIAIGEQGAFEPDEVNNFTLTSAGASESFAGNRAAISITDGLENAITPNGELWHNKITVNGRGAGIRLEQAGNIGLYYNDIDFLNPVSPGENGEQGNGVVLRNSDANYLYENEVSSTSGFTSLNGISVISSEGNVLCCNTTSGTTQGVRFQGTCDPTYLKTTTIGDHDIGLKCEIATQIGEQDNAGNRWAGQYNSFAAEHDGDNFNIVASLFRVNPSFGSEISPPLTAISTPNGTISWFLPGAGTPPDCLFNSADLCTDIPDPFQGGGNGISESDIKLAKGEYSSGAYSLVQDWEKGLQLYGKLEREPSLISTNTYITNFYTEQQNNGTAAYYDIREALKTAYLIPENRQSEFDQRFVDIQNLLQALDNIDLSYRQAISEADSLLLLSEREQTLNELNGVWDDLLSIEQDQISDTESQISTLNSQNDALLNVHIAATNQKAVNGVLLKYGFEKITNYEASDIQALENISYQCPLFGGNAVFRARSILKAYSSYEFTDLLNNCQSLALQSNNSSSLQPAIDSRTDRDEIMDGTPFGKWSVYPNPTTDYITISGGDIFELIDARLYDLTGKLCQIWRSSDLESTLSVKTTIKTEGIYYLELRYIDGTSEMLKIVIIR